jgi:hypothetical protein
MQVKLAFDLDFDFLERRGPSELVTTLKAVARLGGCKCSGNGGFDGLLLTTRLKLIRCPM